MIAAGAVTTAKLAANAVTSTKIATEAVETADIKEEAVTSALIAANAVTGSRLAGASAAPAKPAEGAVTVAVVSPGRKVSAALTGNAAKKGFAIKHNLNTRLLVVSIQKVEAGEPGPVEPLVAATVEVKPLSANEVEVIFVVAPGAGTELFVTVIG